MKNEKKLSARKLPGIFKKSYTEKNLEKKILKKLYIDSDRKLVKNLFSEKVEKKKNVFYRVPCDAQFTKKEIKAFKVLARQIKSNKGVVRAKAFIAAASVLALIIISVTVFKNTVAKWGIKTVMQTIYGSKCDIASVNISFLDAKLTVNRLAQANPNHPMKNFYEFEKLELDFNLTELLKARFNVQNAEITGVAFDTKRTESGALPVKVDLGKNGEKNDSTGFYSSIKEKSEEALKTAHSSFLNMFDQYDAESFVASLKEKFQTASVAKEIETDLNALIGKWKDRPGEIKKNVDDFSETSESLVKINASKLKTPEEIREALTKVVSAIETGKRLNDNLNSTVKDLDGDKKTIAEFQQKLQTAVKNDKNLLLAQTGNFSMNGVSDFISGTADSFGYSFLGKYYPYYKKAVTYAISMKNSGSSSEKSSSADVKKNIKKEKEAARKERKRYEGRYVFWRADTVPRILIENIHGSGYGLDFKVKNVSSDMDKVGKPLTADFSFTDKKRTHKASLEIDARSYSSAPLISASYSGDNFPLKVELADFVKNAGLSKQQVSELVVPELSGTAGIKASLTADVDYSFGGKCIVAMNPVTAKAPKISPDYADKIYSTALSAVKSLNADCAFGFSEEKGVSLEVKTDLEKQFMSGLKASAGEIMASVKEEAASIISRNIDENTKDSFGKITQFGEISKQIGDSNSSVKKMNEELAAKQKELTKQLSAKVTDKVTGKAAGTISDSGAGKAVSGAASNLLKNLKK